MDTAIVEDHGLSMVTRDGVRLVADVYRPAGDGRHPVILLRTPYDRSVRLHGGPPPEAEFFVPRGFAVVVQDARGRGESEGTYVPWVDDGQDGYDAVEWAATLDCADGRVGMAGQSALGTAQYLTAATRPPHLFAAAPTSGPVSFFEHRLFRRGVFEMGWSLSYMLAMSRATLVRQGRYREKRSFIDAWVENPKKPGGFLTDEAYRHVPVADWGTRLGEVGAGYVADFLRHDVDGPFWWHMDVRRRFADITAPMLHVGSWYDAFQFDTLAMYQGLRDGAMTDEARRGQKLVMGPWAHLHPFTTPTSGSTGDLDFGDDSKIELLEMQLRWFDHFLRGRDNGVLDEAPVRIFVMGVNRWRDEDEWPLRRARIRELYAHSGGAANSLRGDGTMSFEAPGEEPEDMFVYDPHDPVPSCGGPLPNEGQGVFDQRGVEARDDVLVYTSAPMSAPLEITGEVRARVFAASSAPDTDFTAKLVDVWPNGYAQNLVEGIIRACYRESLREPSPIEPNVVYAYDFRLDATSHVVLPGHALRLEISSSNFPRFARNPNTGGSAMTETQYVPATQRVFHDHRYPTHLRLPIVES